MGIVQFDFKKSIDVVNVTGTPTISRALPFKIVSGDSTLTGTGEIILDWTNITAQEHIGVFDENEQLLDYYVEKFDATNKIATIWVYRDWIQDGSTQAKIAYGGGSTDHSVNAATIFDKESNLVSGYLFNESAGDLLDITSNNHDGSNNGAARDQDGIVGKAYYFANDYVQLNSSIPPLNSLTISFWLNIDNPTTADSEYFIAFRDNQDIRIRKNSGIIYFEFSTTDSSARLEVTAPSGWHYFTFRWDGATAELLQDLVLEDSASISGDPNPYNESDRFGMATWVNAYEFYGYNAVSFVYDNTFSDDLEQGLYDASKSSPDFFSQQSSVEIEIFLIGQTLNINSGFENTGLVKVINLLNSNISASSTITIPYLFVVRLIFNPEDINSNSVVSDSPSGKVAKFILNNIAIDSSISFENIFVTRSLSVWNIKSDSEFLDASIIRVKNLYSSDINFNFELGAIDSEIHGYLLSDLISATRISNARMYKLSDLRALHSERIVVISLEDRTSIIPKEDRTIEVN